MKSLKIVVIFHTFYVRFTTPVTEDLIILLRPIKRYGQYRSWDNTGKIQYCKTRQNGKHNVALKQEEILINKTGRNSGEKFSLKFNQLMSNASLW